MWPQLGQSKSFLSPDMWTKERAWESESANAHPSCKQSHLRMVHREEKAERPRWHLVDTMDGWVSRGIPCIPSHTERYCSWETCKEWFINGELARNSQSLHILPAPPGMSESISKLLWATIKNLPVLWGQGLPVQSRHWLAKSPSSRVPERPGWTCDSLHVTLPQTQPFSPGSTNSTVRENELPESACTLAEIHLQSYPNAIQINPCVPYSQGKGLFHEISSFKKSETKGIL